MLHELQKNFSDYLRGRDSRLIDYIQNDGLVNIETRLDIYRNAYQIRLRECIDSDHPILGNYLGDDLFDQMVKSYIKENPSTYTSLRHFSDQLPEFLKQHQPFSEYPVIAEIARFERRLMFSFDAADSATASLEDLQQIEPESWPAIQISFHPSAGLFNTDWNCVEIWQAIKNEEAPPDAEEKPTDWLIWRDQERLTQYRVLDNIGVAIFSSFQQGENFASVCELLLGTLPEQAISQSVVTHLVDWLSQGVIEKVAV